MKDAGALWYIVARALCWYPVHPQPLSLAYACCHTGALLLYHTGALAYWSAGPVHHNGALPYCHTGMLAAWALGLGILSCCTATQCTNLVHWPSVSLCEMQYRNVEEGPFSIYRYPQKGDRGAPVAGPGANMSL